MDQNDPKNANRDSNPDLITNAPGSHPVSTGVGAAAAGAAGAAIGSIVPGIGTLIGGAIGAVVGAVGGGYAGKAVGEVIDPTGPGTDEYWKDNHKTSASAKAGDYGTYRPAYQYGATLADRSTTNAFDEKTARTDWESNAETKSMNFDTAKGAIRDEFNRKIQLREEQLRVNKERVSAGDVGVHKVVTTTQQTVQVPVEHEELVITRHAATGTAVGEIGDEEIRIPLSEERVNVSKETVVTGEVEVAKRKVTDTQTVGGSVRKEDVSIDKTGNARLDDRTKNM